LNPKANLEAKPDKTAPSVAVKPAPGTKSKKATVAKSATEKVPEKAGGPQPPAKQ
jgi:hypothetical protein